MWDWIFEIHQLWQSGFSRVYSNCCCSYSFELEIIKTGQSSHKMYSNNIVKFQESTTILNACTKKSLETYWRPHVYVLRGSPTSEQELRTRWLHLLQSDYTPTLSTTPTKGCPGYDFKLHLFRWGSNSASLGQCGMPFHCHFSLVYFDPAWYYTLGSNFGGQIDLLETHMYKIWLLETIWLYTKKLFSSKKEILLETTFLYRLLVLDKNTWYPITMSKLFGCSGWHINLRGLCNAKAIIDDCPVNWFFSEC